jgi:hypothetical protein
MFIGMRCFAGQPALPDQNESLDVDGNIYVWTIDSRHIIVAVDHDKRGSADHVFLYTASERLRVSLKVSSWRGRISYRSGTSLLVVLRNQPQALEFILDRDFKSDRTGQTIRFSNTTDLLHYRPVTPMQIKDLTAGSHTGDCDVSPRACFKVAGEFLPFSD